MTRIWRQTLAGLCVVGLMVAGAGAQEAEAPARATGF